MVAICFLRILRSCWREKEGWIFNGFYALSNEWMAIWNKLLLLWKKWCRNLIKNWILFCNHKVGKKLNSEPFLVYEQILIEKKNFIVAVFREQFVFGHRNHGCASLVKIFIRIFHKLSTYFSFFNFLRNSGRFFRFLRKVLDCLWKLQNEKFNIRRKAKKLQISEKF